jgi:predicted amidophosphoribosyltransferase
MPTFKHPCLHCGGYIARDVARCPFCGVVDPFVAGRCPTCRTEIEDASWVACPSCGAPLREGIAPMPGSVPAAPAASSAPSVPSPAGDAVPVPPAPPRAEPPAAVATPASACPACGATLGPGARFCAVCGTLVG